MEPTRAQFEAELAKLDALIPELKADYPDEADFWPAFACLADALAEEVTVDDCAWWTAELNALMARHGLVSGWPADT